MKSKLKLQITKFLFGKQLVFQKYLSRRHVLIANIIVRKVTNEIQSEITNY